MSVGLGGCGWVVADGWLRMGGCGWVVVDGWLWMGGCGRVDEKVDLMQKGSEREREEALVA